MLIWLDSKAESHYTFISNGVTIILRLKQLREEKKLSQKKLGEYVLLTQQQVESYEKGKYEPDITTLLRLADFFNISLDFLVGRSDFRTPRQEGDWHLSTAILGEIEEVCRRSREKLNKVHPSCDQLILADTISDALLKSNVISNMNLGKTKDIILDQLSNP